MSTMVKAISLSTINASGTSMRALYSALTTNMFFGQLSPLEIRVDKGIAKPYFTVPLPALDGLNTMTKKALLLASCLQETAEQLKQLSSVISLNAIEQVIISTSIITDSQATHLDNESAIEDSDTENLKKEWQQIAIETVNDYLAQLTDKVVFNYSHKPMLDQTITTSIPHSSIQAPNNATKSNTTKNNATKSNEAASSEIESSETTLSSKNKTANTARPILLVNIESLCDYNQIKNLNKLLDIQCHQGEAGVMPAEGATSTLLIPNTYPAIKHSALVAVKALNSNQQLSIKMQLTQANFSIPSHVLHVGSISPAWVAHWYGQSNGFYHQLTNQATNDETAAQTTNLPTEKSLTLYQQTNVLGYLGVANLTTALASATALLTSPIENASVIWVVEHLVNSKNTQQPLANVYQVTVPLHDNSQPKAK